MPLYRLTPLGNSVERLSDGAVIPFDPNNIDYQLYLSWVADGSAPESASAPTLVELKQLKLADVNGAFEEATAKLTVGYPPSEKDSWPNQTNEAMAWYADNNAPTPYLDALAGFRGIDPIDYRQRTVNKIMLYKEASAFLIGTRQKYADQIEAAEDDADLEAIVPVFTLPE